MLPHHLHHNHPRHQPNHATPPQTPDPRSHHPRQFPSTTIPRQPNPPPMPFPPPPPPPQSPPPSSPLSSPPIASLLSRLARRHSLPASSIHNPVDLPASPAGELTHPDETTATTRPNTSDDAIGGVGRGRGHRHTRSDAPVVVRRYNPPRSTEVAAAKRGSRVLSLLGIEREVGFCVL